MLRSTGGLRLSQASSGFQVLSDISPWLYLATVEVAWEDPNTDIDVYLYGEDVFNSIKAMEIHRRCVGAAPVESSKRKWT